jgi:hypoxanthine phosphoribosyltransferase
MKNDMSEKSYAYQNRKGLLTISWNDIHGICKCLVQAVDSFRPDVILAVGRGGYYPGTLLAHLLQIEIYPIWLSRRVADVVRYASPRWLILPPEPEVINRKVLVVDEICDSGETLQVVIERVQEIGAVQVRSAVLYSHTWKATVPDYIGVITDELVLNPWDREIWVDGRFQFHPEYAAALQEQGIEPAADLLMDAPVYPLAKGP